jgi:hypothetical protein
VISGNEETTSLVYRRVEFMPSVYHCPPNSSPLVSDLREWEQSPYKTSFGGPPRHEGVVPAGCSRPLHLLFNLDLSDPCCRIDFPNVRFLPLYYAFQYDASALWYCVVSDTAIEIVHQAKTVWLDDFPFKGYPAEFPPSAIEVGEPRAVTEFLNSRTESGSTVWEDWAANVSEQGNLPDHNDMIACHALLWQGAPKTACRNRTCNRQTMDILAVIEPNPVANVSLWGEYDDEGIQIIYQCCPRCRIIYVTNQCT